MLRRTVLSSLATFVAVTASGVFKRSRGQLSPFTPTYEPHQASVAGFLPSTSGFHFENCFTNTCPSSSSRPPNEPDIQLTIEGISFTAGNAGDGLCGGFVFGAADYFLAGQPIPATTTTPVPFTTLYNYLVKRQVDSFGPSVNVIPNAPSILSSNAMKVVTYIGISDDEMAAAIANVEFPAIKSDIDNGRLSLLI